MDYQRYLASREWALKKEAVRKRSRNSCERCGRVPMQATHHLTYERIGNELLEDLQGVCNPCHEFLSAKTNIDPVETSYQEDLALFSGVIFDFDSDVRDKIYFLMLWCDPDSRGGTRLLRDLIAQLEASFPKEAKG
jgi:hypothetical protein